MMFSPGCVGDAGANIGYFSQQVGVAGKVIAIEAAPRTVERLRTSIALNNAEVTVVEAAITSQKGEVTLQIHPDYDLWNRITHPLRVIPTATWASKWIPVTVKGDTRARSRTI